MTSYRKTIQGVTADMYGNQRTNSKRRNHELPVYTLDELREFTFKRPIFYVLYDLWVESNFNKMQKPSIDRLDDSKGYSLDNIQIMTWQQNKDKYGKSVVQMTLSGEVVKVFKSGKEASRVLNISAGNIASVCKGKRSTAGGFIFKYTS